MGTVNPEMLATKIFNVSVMHATLTSINVKVSVQALATI